jgi:hypothetical protein
MGGNRISSMIARFKPRVRRSIRRPRERWAAGVLHEEKERENEEESYVSVNARFCG